MTRHVYVDPSGTLGEIPWAWAAVVVRARTGVVYEHQYGGVQCFQGAVEGYRVPVHGGEGLGQLLEIFVEDLGGSGLRGERPPAIMERIKRAVGQIYFFGSRPEAGSRDEPWRPSSG